MPASASGVIFATIEDETGHANSSAIACRGKVQREGEVIHVVAANLIDLTHLLRQVGHRDENVGLPDTRADQARLTGAPDPRIPRTRDIPDPHLRVGEGLTVKSRNFR